MRFAKLFLTIILLTVQSSSAKKIFVEIEFHKNSILINDGTSKKGQAIQDENGVVLKFKSLIGALNYMSLQGWELLDIKTVTKGSGYVGKYGGGSSTSTDLYYLFCREVPDAELENTVINSYDESYSKSTLIVKRRADGEIISDYTIQFFRRDIRGNSWDLVKTQFFQDLSKEELQTIIDKWKTQVSEKYVYNCVIKKHD